jgi:hypothetical protein
MSDKSDCRLFVEVKDETALRALGPEVGDLEGSDGQVTEDGIVVHTDGPRSLRAAVNGWTRLISVANDDRLQP